MFFIISFKEKYIFGGFNYPNRGKQIVKSKERLRLIAVVIFSNTMDFNLVGAGEFF